MARPCIKRTCSCAVRHKAFKPLGAANDRVKWVPLTLDEYEALRLADGQGLDQVDVADSMGVSRPTVSRILNRARAKVADMLVNGTGIVIEGGPVKPNVDCHRRRCRLKGRCDCQKDKTNCKCGGTNNVR